MGKPSKGSKSNSKPSKPAPKSAPVPAPEKQYTPLARPAKGGEHSRSGKK
jgi:hypothetical protein